MGKRTKRASRDRDNFKKDYEARNQERDFRSKMDSRRTTIEPQTEGQSVYLETIRATDITFGIGPAGSGKTYIATALAAINFINNQYDRIILVRPAVEAGEKLGFLPGDLNEKIDPYMRPIFDALYAYIPPQRVKSLMEYQQIEVAPLAYMRGRTLDHAFIILDEAQNTSIAQMKMFLTRIGKDSKVVVTGDTSQTDLPRNIQSGLADAIERLEGIDGIAVCRLGVEDIVRHDLVQKIVEAYEDTQE